MTDFLDIDDVCKLFLGLKMAVCHAIGPEGAASVDEALASFAKNSTSCSAPVTWIFQCAVDGGIPGGDYSAVPTRPKLELVRSDAD